MIACRGGDITIVVLSVTFSSKGLVLAMDTPGMLVLACLVQLHIK